MTLGEKIRILRIENGVSQEELAKLLNTTKQAIYKYENNIVTNIPLSKIQVLADFFNVSPAYLTGWENTNEMKFSEFEKKIILAYRNTDPITKNNINKLLDL